MLTAVPFYYSYMSQCHEKWDEADLTIQRGQCEGLCLIFVRPYCVHNLNWTFAHRTCRLRGEPGPRVRPVDPPQLHQGPGPLHEGGAQDPEQGAPAASAAAAATALKKLEKKSVSNKQRRFIEEKVDNASKEYSKLGFSKFVIFWGAKSL